jgi:hypothetical protein
MADVLNNSQDYSVTRPSFDALRAYYGQKLDELLMLVKVHLPLV